MEFQQPRRKRHHKPGLTLLTPPDGMPSFPCGQQPTAPPATTAKPPEAVVDPCVCGHTRAAHEHYRRGSDCGACGAQACPKYHLEAGAVPRPMRRPSRAKRAE